MSAVPSGDALLKFERLLAELSARFINLPASQIDDAITDALRQIVILLDVDRSQLIRFTGEPGVAQVTHSWAVEDVPLVPPKSLTESFPWAIRCLQIGRPVIIARLDDLPPEASVDTASFVRVGVKSNLTMPMIVSGRVEGAITFGCLRRERTWPADLVARVRVLAEVFANALAHKRTEETLSAAMEFERLVSDTFSRLLTAASGEMDAVIDRSLREMAQVLGAERATLWGRVAGKGEFRKTHRWLAEGVPVPPSTTGSAALPWISRQIIAGALVRFVRLEELPPEAAADLPMLRELAIRSMILVPLVTPSEVVGALSFATVHEERGWPEALVPRVKLLGEVFASVLARNESERREAEATAQAIHAARVGTMGAFTASLAHELTQPLAAIQSNAETAARLLNLPTPDLDELRSTLQDIVADDRRAADLIHKLRRYLRKGEAERQALDLRAALTEAIRFVNSAAADQGIELWVDAGNGLRIDGDPVQIQQVLVNLMLNAFDAVASRDSGARQVTVIARQEPSGVSVEVTDSGTGMSDNTLMQIFQPFFTTKPGGMGLGLSISRSIVEAHGGALTARSTPDRGTTFRIEFPAMPSGHSRPSRQPEA
jgi:signal transduction histidine kinase